MKHLVLLVVSCLRICMVWEVQSLNVPCLFLVAGRMLPVETFTFAGSGMTDTF